MPVAREQLSTAMLDHGECSKAVIFQFENKVGVIERSGPLQERHGTEGVGHSALSTITAVWMNRQMTRMRGPHNSDPLGILLTIVFWPHRLQ
jgi:hypothetical protein